MRNFEDKVRFNLEHFSQPIEEPEVSVAETLENTKEKIFDYLKYKSLKVKEYFGQLEENDFDELLDFDFQEELKDNPPLTEVFSPEKELTEIKKLPKEQKKEALSAFKENLAAQRKALAACRVFIERSIEFNHDVPREKLVELVEKFTEKYGFTENQKQISKQLIDGYYKNRQKALEIRQRIPDDTELINKLTGVKINKNEKVDVTVGPMTIDIDADNFTTGRLFEMADKPVIAQRYGGFASNSGDENPVYYIVINQDKELGKEYDDPTGKNRRKHEYEHQKNALFKTVFEHQNPKTDINLKEYRQEKDSEIKKEAIENFLYPRQMYALNQVKDEITASLHDRTLRRLQQSLNSFFFKQDNCPYDYLAYLRDPKQMKGDPLYQEAVQKILVKEYREIIENAVESYAELIEKGEYSTQEAIALLTDKPLSDWPKTIRRLLEQK